MSVVTRQRGYCIACHAVLVQSAGGKDVSEGWEGCAGVIAFLYVSDVLKRCRNKFSGTNKKINYRTHQETARQI
jgi:hypothetical protein